MDALDALRQHRAKEREAARLRAALREQRELLVQEACQAGFSGREIAAALGVSKERVYQLVREAAAQRTAGRRHHVPAHPTAHAAAAR